MWNIGYHSGPNVLNGSTQSDSRKEQKHRSKWYNYLIWARRIIVKVFFFQVHQLIQLIYPYRALHTQLRVLYQQQVIFISSWGWCSNNKKSKRDLCIKIELQSHRSNFRFSKKVRKRLVVQWKFCDFPWYSLVRFQPYFSLVLINRFGCCSCCVRCSLLLLWYLNFHLTLTRSKYKES